MRIRRCFSGSEGGENRGVRGRVIGGAILPAGRNIRNSATICDGAGGRGVGRVLVVVWGVGVCAGGADRLLVGWAPPAIRGPLAFGLARRQYTLANAGVEPGLGDRGARRGRK